MKIKVVDNDVTKAFKALSSMRAACRITPKILKVKSYYVKPSMQNRMRELAVQSKIRKASHQRRQESGQKF